MAITITVGGNNITAYVPLLGDSTFGLPPFGINEDANGYTGKATIPIIDNAGAVSIAAKDVVAIADGGTTLFAGYVAHMRRLPRAADTVTYVLDCQDKNILLEETAIQSEAFAAGQADSAIIDDLFTTYLPAIDSTTYVSTLDASMEAIEFAAQTLRECLSMIAERSGGRFYIDYDGNLHYFSAESNALAWNLSDSPNFSTLYPYDDLEEVTDATVIVDRVLVVGTEVEGWVGTGDYDAVIWDPSITTAQGITDRGNALIARYQNGLISYRCTIWKDGARAGMDLDLTNALLGLSAATLTIRRLRMTPASADGALREYELELGEAILTSAAASRGITDLARRTASQVNSIDDTVFDVDAPAAPDLQTGNLSTGVNVQGDGTQLVFVVVTWGIVSDSDLNQYEVQISTASDFSSNVQTRLHAKDGDREERWEGLLGGTTYYVRVRAVDWVGNPSAWSTVRNITSSADSSAPSQVTGAAAAGARTLIGLTWTASSAADLAYYEVQRSPNGSTDWATKATIRTTHWIDQDFSEAQVLAATTFYYRVRAVDTSGNPGTYSSTVNAALNPLGSDSLAADCVIARLVGANEIITTSANIGTAIIESANIHEVYAEKLAVTVGGYNLLINSGMNDDDDGDGVPDEWTESGNITNHTNQLDPGWKVVGGASFRMDVNAGDTSGDSQNIYQDITLADVPLAVGDDFVLSGYIKAATLANLTVQLVAQWFDSAPSVLRTDAISVTSNQEFTRHTLTNTVPTGAVTCRVFCVVVLTADNGTGTAWWDAIKVERGDVPTAWTTGMIGHVTIDANRVQVTDSDAKVWLGKRGATLGLFGEDAAGDLQVYIDASDGRLYAGGGAVHLDAIGLTIDQGVGGANSVQWMDGATQVADIRADNAGHEAYLYLHANAADTDDEARIILLADSTPMIQLSVGAFTGTGEGGIWIYQTHIEANVSIRTAGAMLIGDGITAPGATAGYATIYVDAADEDLKVRFADGVTKTLATDT